MLRAAPDEPLERVPPELKLLLRVDEPELKLLDEEGREVLREDETLDGEDASLRPRVEEETDDAGDEEAGREDEFTFAGHFA